ncbi:MAG: hypothetical protein A2X12_06605 [Bacteroidetes bacterium GWE2_29_8]|nr:MAG: hypothetical protein A2X12_06605 [Bacteroidetes bacterium GWE2_29_8]
MSNIFDIEGIDVSKEEFFLKLFDSDNIIIEKIVSQGQVTKEGEYMQQDFAEWVILLEGEANLDIEQRGELFLKKGDYVYIEPKQRHRILYTSVEPKCLWLAFHFKCIN